MGWAAKVKHRGPGQAHSSTRKGHIPPEQIWGKETLAKTVVASFNQLPPSSKRKAEPAEKRRRRRYHRRIPLGRLRHTTPLLPIPRGHRRPEFSCTCFQEQHKRRGNRAGLCDSHLAMALNRPTR
jgi:hypothetical protein